MASESLICALCPRGCRMEVSFEEGAVTARGNACARGLEYARSELVDPRRVLTTTVRTVFRDRPRLPVRTTGELPKGRLVEAARALDGVTVDWRARVGDIVAKDLLGLGVDVAATDDLEPDEF